MLSKTTEYALRAAVCLAQPPQLTCSSEVLAARTQIPRRYLHKVIQDLVTAGLVRSQPGPGGGYTLAQPAQQVTILDVVNAVAPIPRITTCPLGLKSHTSLCPLHRELDNTYATIQTALGRVTLNQVAGTGEGIMPLCEITVDGTLPATAAVAVADDAHKTPAHGRRKSAARSRK